MSLIKRTILKSTHITLGLILSALHFKWRLYTTHLGVSPPPSGMTTPNFFISFLHPFLFFLFTAPPLILLLCYHAILLILVFTFYSSSSVHLFLQVVIIIILTIFVFLSLPFKSESSHLLNHLIKFDSSGNLLWVSHHILLKQKHINKVEPIKMCNPKINSHHVVFKA